jgi:hypothetical protein
VSEKKVVATISPQRQKLDECPLSLSGRATAIAKKDENTIDTTRRFFPVIWSIESKAISERTPLSGGVPSRQSNIELQKNKQEEALR